jgi:Tol biopolymer transport system component
LPRHARRTLALASLAIVIAGAIPAPTLATFPGSNGRITFMRFDENGEFQVWAANPGMTHQVQLTHGPGSDAWFPAWSPDGTRIAFSSHRSDPDPTDDFEIADIFTMRADGTDVRQVTDLREYTANASWSPDGRWLVISTDRGAGQQIEIMPSDGSAPPHPIATNPPSSIGQELARFSPNGKRIVFNEVRVVDGPDGPVEQGALFTVAPDGSKLHRITPWEIYAADADWSPDGSRIVVAARLADNDLVQSVMVVDADGQHLRSLTRGDQARGDGADFRYQESFNPAWSPDGARIIFVRATYTDADGFAMGLQTMKSNGSARTALSFGEEHQPDWGSAAPLP